MKKFVLLFISLSLVSVSFCQYQNSFDSTDKLASVDSIIHTLYDVISGPAGQQRDWNLFKSLFADDAKMYIAIPDKNNSTSLKSIAPEEYAQRNQTRLADIGFNEAELYRIINSYGSGTQVFSTYESHFTNKNGEEEMMKGINNIQLFFDGERYYIVSIFWDANAKNIEVPERYLPKDKNTKYQINL